VPPHRWRSRRSHVHSASRHCRGGTWRTPSGAAPWPALDATAAARVAAVRRPARAWMASTGRAGRRFVHCGSGIGGPPRARPEPAPGGAPPISVSVYRDAFGRQQSGYRNLANPVVVPCRGPLRDSTRRGSFPRVPVKPEPASRGAVRPGRRDDAAVETLGARLIRGDLPRQINAADLAGKLVARGVLRMLACLALGDQRPPPNSMPAT